VRSHPSLLVGDLSLDGTLLPINVLRGLDEGGDLIFLRNDLGGSLLDRRLAHPLLGRRTVDSRLIIIAVLLLGTLLRGGLGLGRLGRLGRS